MSTSNNPKTLYTKYFEEFGVIPDRAEYFINFCKKHGVELRYKDCRQLFANPPIRRNGGGSAILSDHSEDEEEEEEELKYGGDDTPNSNHQQSPSPATPSPILYNGQNNTDCKTKKFQLLNNTKTSQHITTAVELEVNGSNYLSPEILIDKMIPLNDNYNIISYHRDLRELEINKCYLIRDAIFFILYWMGLVNGIFNYFHFNLWYFRFLCLLIWHCSLLIGLISHIYYRSPPFYSLYRGSDCKYMKNFDISAIEYIKEWNDKEHIENIENIANIENNQRSLGIHLFFIEMFGGLSDSKCGLIEIEAKKILNKSCDILQDIKKQKNQLIRLRIYHILRFNDVESHNKFKRILSEKKSGFKRAEQMFHIEYNIDIKERLLMNTTHSINNNTNFWNLWNDCCSNKKMSYFWYIIGCGFIYRLYHDCCIKTQIYDCVKEVTL